MANPTTLNHIPFAVLVTSPTIQAIVLDPDRKYGVAHDSESELGASDTHRVYLGLQDTLTAVGTSGGSRIKLPAGRSVVIGPGIGMLYFICEAGGAPTISIAAGRALMGRY